MCIRNAFDIERLKETESENLPSSSGHRTILLLTPALEYTLLACSCWRQSWTRRRAPPPKSLSTRYTSAYISTPRFLTMAMLIVFFAYLWELSYWLYNVTRQQRVGLQDGKNPTDVSGRHSAICSDHNNRKSVWKMETGRCKVGTPLSWIRLQL